MTPRLRFMLWTLVVFLLFTGQVSWLFLLRGPRVLSSDGVLIGGQFLLTLPILVIALLLKTTPPDAIKLRRRTSEWLILGGLALLQFAAVAMLRPALSEDVLRYRVDGRMWLDGVSPYATTPRDWKHSDAIDALVPFAEMRTIYPAVSQLTFTIAAAIENITATPADAPLQSGASRWRPYLETAQSPYRATVFRSMYALAAVAMTFVLLQVLRTMDQSPWWSVIVAWNPLVTLEIGGMGHHDVVGVMLLVLSLYALAGGRQNLSVIWLALAAAVKPFALFIAPFGLRNVHPAKRLAAACLFATILAALYFPPLLFQHGYTGWRGSAQTYSQTWEANGSTYELIVRTFGDGDEGRANERAKQMARVLAAAALLGTALAAWNYRASPIVAGYWLCLVALLVSPVAYPWYLLWALAFVPLSRGEVGWTAIVWSGTIGMNYLMWHTPAWRMSNSALVAEYGVVYAALMFEIACAIRRARLIAGATATAAATSDSRSSRCDPSPLRGSSA